MANTTLKKKSSIIIAAIVGGAIGAIVGWLWGLSLAGTVLGLLVGGGVGYLIHTTPKNKKMSDATVQLREEKLNISKEPVKTGDVSMHTENIREVKHIDIPVNRKELVIRKNFFDPKAPNDKDKHLETIRIPLGEERIDIIKNPKKLTDVSIYRNKFQEYQSVKETLKKEKAHVEWNKNPKD